MKYPRNKGLLKKALKKFRLFFSLRPTITCHLAAISGKLPTNVPPLVILSQHTTFFHLPFVFLGYCVAPHFKIIKSQEGVSKKEIFASECSAAYPTPGKKQKSYASRARSISRKKGKGRSLGIDIHLSVWSLHSTIRDSVSRG